MKLKPLALGLTFGLMCALALVGIYFLPAMTELIFGTAYGEGLKALLMDTYPYYGAGLASTFVAVVLAFIDAFIGGIIFAWVYNLIGGSKK